MENSMTLGDFPGRPHLHLHELTMPELAERLESVRTEASTRIEGLERWQTAQNGTLKRLEEKADASAARHDRLMLWIMSTAFTALLALAGIIVSLLRMK